MPRHIAWTDIENFHSMRRSFQKRPDLLPDCRNVVTYCGKVKLHGTNAGVVIEPDGNVYAMSRTSVITPTNDNVGFAKWVEDRREQFSSKRLQIGTLILYGEWCGPGIQKGVAISQIKERTFAVFASKTVDSPSEVDFFDNPDVLEAMVNGVPGVSVIPWFNDAELFTVDWAASPEELENVLARINARVAEVEARDPFTAKQFGVDGVGEGLVMYPVTTVMEGVNRKIPLFNCNYNYFSALVFKAKGEKHQVVGRTKPAQADAAKAEDVQAFVDIVLPVARLEQGLSVVSPAGADQKFIPHFLKWVHDDVVKECQAELEASGLDQKNALRAVTARARLWYIDMARKL